jgi:Ca2+-binding RTX toxin-like protein
MPTSWPAAAQQAQMLAGRTFALNRYLHYENPGLRASGDAGLPDTQKANCWCHVYDTTASQVYGGIDATTPERVAAAAATSGRVIAYLGPDAASYTKSNVIESLYSSSNGGQTMANTDAYGSSKQYPYLIAIDDPWSIDPTAENPNAEWVVERTPDFIAELLEWDELRGIWLIDTDPSVVRFEGIDDGEIVVEDRKGDSLRRAAQLLSGHVTEIRVQGVPTCSGRFATMWGTSGPDTLIGSAAHDVIIGRAGNDTIEGRGGHDIICGGTGDDTIHGNHGDDRIYGGAGHDIVFGDAGLDVISGGGGRDTIDGGGSADELDGNAGDDTIIGGSGADQLRGGGGLDVLDGQGGPDRLIGNAGDDHLIGGAHSDRLNGGPDSDTLDGSDGYNDRCTGGTGTDTATDQCEVVNSVP